MCFTRLMRSSARSRFLLLFALLFAAGVGGWFYFEHSTRPEVVVGGPSPTLSSEAPASAGHLVTDAAASPAPEPLRNHIGLSGDTAAGGAASLTAGDILAEPDEDLVRVAKKLGALVADSRAPMAEREEALAHALNLAAGNEREVLLPMVKNPGVTDEMVQTILSEALNSSLSYQADIYLEALAARQNSELQAAIREHLAFLTGGDDLGTDVAAWKKALAVVKPTWPE